MTTALQQAFARLEELHPSLFDIHTEKGRTFVNEFSKFLEVEKEQIINACKQFSYSYEEAEQYYNETFKSE
jgi:DNA-binding transcriptional regulator YhcF (GntR family)